MAWPAGKLGFPSMAPNFLEKRITVVSGHRLGYAIKRSSSRPVNPTFRAGLRSNLARHFARVELDIFPFKENIHFLNSGKTFSLLIFYFFQNKNK